jgi:hypothetical protein
MTHKYANQLTKNMVKYELYESGMNKRPRFYELFKMFSPHSYTGGVGKYDGDYLDKKGRHDDEKLLYRFY